VSGAGRIHGDTEGYCNPVKEQQDRRSRNYPRQVVKVNLKASWVERAHRESQLLGWRPHSKLKIPAQSNPDKLIELWWCEWVITMNAQHMYISLTDRKQPIGRAEKGF